MSAPHVLFGDGMKHTKIIITVCKDNNMTKLKDADIQSFSAKKNDNQLRINLSELD